MITNFLVRIELLYQNFVNSVIAIIKILFFAKFNLKRPKINGKTAIYLANGTSLNETIERMKTEIDCSNIVVSNFFCRSDFFTDLKPNYYIICDPAFCLKEPINDNFKNFYLEFYKTVTWPLSFFIPINFKKDFLRIEKTLGLKNDNISVYYFNLNALRGSHSLILFLFSQRLGMPSSTSVAIPALMQTINLGFTNIYISGIDLDVHNQIRVSEDNVVEFKSVHFYTKDESEIKYIPYYTNPSRTSVFSSTDTFRIFYKRLESFDIIAKYAKYKKVEILNYSKNSFLDQFRKI